MNFPSSFFFVLFIPRSLKRRHRRLYERLVLAGQNDAKVSTPEALAHGISPRNCATADVPVGNDVSFVFPPVVALLVYCASDRPPAETLPADALRVLSRRALAVVVVFPPSLPSRGLSPMAIDDLKGPTRCMAQPYGRGKNVKVTLFHGAWTIDNGQYGQSSTETDKGGLACVYLEF